MIVEIRRYVCVYVCVYVYCMCFSCRDSQRLICIWMWIDIDGYIMMVGVLP